MKPSVIAAIGHVALGVRDLDVAVEQATTVMGLRVSRRADGQVDLTHGAQHHSLQFRAAAEDVLDHLGLEAEGPDGVAEIRRRLEAGDIPLVAEGPLDEGLEDGLAFELPGGALIEVYTGMPHDEPDYVATGVRPTRFGHVNIYVEDPGPALDVLVDVLDFRISDRVRGGAFTRCNADHHGIAVLPGDRKLHHHAWEVRDAGELVRLGDVLHARGEGLVEGPVRHGIGGNIAAYFRGPAGAAVEFYTDMEVILDDAAFVPRDWDVQGTSWYSRWVPRMPPEEFRHLGAPFAPVSVGTAAG
ncbi:MAG: catechol 2,3-dioxygenase [Gaiellaceae bacterium]|nr:catechol 2,3-dioxygenase [Gaiellaceae bacterium]